MKTRSGSQKGVTLVELLVVISIIAFLAGALVVSAQRIRHQAQVSGTRALIEKISGANERLYNDLRHYAPDSAIGALAGNTWVFSTSPGLPEEYTNEEVDNTVYGMPNDRIMTTANECMTLGLCFFWDKNYLTVNQEHLAGPKREINKVVSEHQCDRSSRCIVVDSWGHPLYYECHRPEGKRYVDDVYWHNTQAFDVFSAGPDGRTSSVSNELDDDGDGEVDETDEGLKLGEQVDDINNWRGTSRK